MAAPGQPLPSATGISISNPGPNLRGYLPYRASRAHCYERLRACSDRQLADIGLERKDIPRAVYYELTRSDHEIYGRPRSDATAQGENFGPARRRLAILEPGLPSGLATVF